MEKILKKIDVLASEYRKYGYEFNRGATEEELKMFVARCKNELGLIPPDQYLYFLNKFDGLVVEGVFLYSTRPIKIIGCSGHSLEFVEMNVLSRDLEWMNEFVVFGDSDQDEYVLDVASNIYQVRDKQAFDNVYEEFDSFSGLFEHMVDLMLFRV
ncbi:MULTISPECIES: YrhA family protein [Pseudomonas]|uniref:SMI1/KNR4 family protein n=1 Tax=Pseudomonas quercus TaxID=2722792 RepID=A0ABX0YFW1_9PSED|nr:MULTISPECIES: YrhA family protein [Pseudomonas]MBF7142716.1 SMI1/KNR4 family protein [Pseudomonas sp. LY10J]NJP01254.1 SMI1/KNR4 family protein [Pseudomonas quercus]